MSMLSTHDEPGTSRKTHIKKKGKRLAATLLASAILLGGLVTPTLSATPAAAETGNPSASILGQGARPFFAYIKKGEYLYVKSDQPTTYIKSQAGTQYSWASGGKVYGPATADGVWQVYLATGDPANPEGSWQIEARTSTAASSAVQGRVWTNRYHMRQTDGTNPAKANLNLYMNNDTGYTYQVEVKGFRGMNSWIAANSIGNTTTTSSCVSAYESVDNNSGRDSKMNCGDLYRIFFAPPAADLPEKATMAGKTVFVAPKPISQEELDRSELTFTKAVTGTNSFAGTFTSKITPKFQGNYRLEIDTDGDDVFGEANDLAYLLPANGAGTYQYVWDGKDKAGKVVPSSGKKMSARIVFDKVGEMHIVQRDVEGRDGIRVTQLTNPKTNAADSRKVHWNDSKLSKTNRTSTTPVVNASQGVDSLSYVHGWNYVYSCHKTTELCGSWGNNRSIEDWVFDTVNSVAPVQAFGGDPALAIDKTADRSTYTTAGEIVTYNFRVTNTGNLDLENVRVEETSFSGTGALSPVTCPTTNLASGASMDCSATYTVQQADIERGEITNAALAKGNPPGEPEVETPPDVVVVTPVDNPAISLLKEIKNDEATSTAWSPSTSFAKDQTLDYRFTVTNTGNLTLTNVRVDETAFTGSGKMSAITCPVTTLAPAEQTICTASYSPASQADVDQSTIDNTAIATGDAVRNPGVTSDPSSAVAVAPQAPALQLVKTADKTTYVAGDLITYSFTVTNVGNQTLTNVRVNETEFTGSGKMSAVTCPVTTLAPTEQTVCTATYTATQADVDRGTIDNAATATGTPPDGPDVETPPSEVEIPATQTPQLSLVKDVDRKDYKTGDVLNYRFTVTNTGTVTVKDISVEELTFTGSGKLSDVVCPADVSLAPGESTTCTATYTATQADLDRGDIDNTAVAHGTDPKDKPVDSNEDPADVPGTQDPKLAIVKTVDKKTYKAGDTLTYTFVVTNVGNITEYNVVVEEVSFNGSGKLSPVSCPVEETKVLVPGASVTCTATYVATLEDQGSPEPLMNLAVAKGNPGTPETPSILSNEDDAETTPEPLPGPPPVVPLAETGGSGIPMPIVIGAGLVVAAALGLLVVAAYRNRRAALAVRECGDERSVM
jgi:uncharacterized repeat protein (TIGR01451 family)